MRFAKTSLKVAQITGISVYTKNDIYVPSGKEVELLIDYGSEFDDIEEVVPDRYIPPIGYKFHKLSTSPYYQSR